MGNRPEKAFGATIRTLVIHSKDLLYIKHNSQSQIYKMMPEALYYTLLLFNAFVVASYSRGRAFVQSFTSLFVPTASTRPSQTTT